MLETIDHGTVRELRLARPPANAINPELMEKLITALNEASESAEAIVISECGPHDRLAQHFGVHVEHRGLVLLVGAARVGAGPQIVAVLAVGHHAFGLDTDFCERVGIAEAVGVRVGVPGAGHALVDGAVAVVVDRVADLGGARIDGGVGVVAVVAARGRVSEAVTIGIHGLGIVRDRARVDVLVVAAATVPACLRTNFLALYATDSGPAIRGAPVK